jgi:hypothetical protein
MAKSGNPAENADVMDASVRRKTSGGISAYTANRNRRLDENDAEIEKYAGWYVARSMNGETTHTYAPTILELQGNLEQLGLQISDVVLECIPGGPIEFGNDRPAERA